jgi:hypothetical protein
MIKLDPINYKQDGELDRIRKQRGYSYEDEVWVNIFKFIRIALMRRHFRLPTRSPALENASLTTRTS